VKKINDLENDVAKEKFYACFSKNKEFKIMCEIACVLEGEAPVGSEDLKDSSVSDLMSYKYRRLVTCDVEHTSSQYITLP
jgi:hypothetical protein